MLISKLLRLSIIRHNFTASRRVDFPASELGETAFEGSYRPIASPDPLAESRRERDTAAHLLRVHIMQLLALSNETHAGEIQPGLLSFLQSVILVQGGR